MQETSEGQTYFCKECEEEFRNPDVKLQTHTCGKKVNTLKQMNGMHERFDERFPSDYSVVGGGERIEINCLSVKPEQIKSFIESEVQLALAEREKDIVEMIKEKWSGRLEIPTRYMADLLSLISKNK